MKFNATSLMQTCFCVCICVCVCVVLLVTEFDQVQVCSCRRQASDVQVGFAELLQACAAAVAAAAGTGWSHGVRLQTVEALLGSVRQLDNLI